MKQQKPQASQEAEYSLPYHYLPRFARGKFFQHAYWSWGFRYMAGMELVLSLLETEGFDSLLDVGCGDGRFLREANQHFPGLQLAGVDYSERAIALARSMNPELAFDAANIITTAPDKQFDALTLIEVLEHIDPQQIDAFVAALAARLRPSGRLILTVPHVNKPLVEKHFQHFRVAQVKQIFQTWFDIERVEYFDLLPQRSLRLRLLESILAGRGRLFIITNGRILAACYKHYLRHFNHCTRETDCARFALVLRRRPS